MKADIEKAIKGCETCLISNRKQIRNTKFVTTTKYKEKVALDIKEIQKGKKLLLCCVDYFTRKAWVGEIKKKNTEEILKVMNRWFGNCRKPKTVVTDNGREFGSVDFRRYLRDN